MPVLVCFAFNLCFCLYVIWLSSPGFILPLGVVGLRSRRISSSPGTA